MKVRRFIKSYLMDYNIPTYIKDRSVVDLISKGPENSKWNPITAWRFYQKYFPNKPEKIQVLTYICKLDNKKYCSLCKEVKPFSEFSNNKSTSDGLQINCKKCRNVLATNYRLERLKRMPRWANLEDIAEFYKNRPPRLPCRPHHPNKG